MARRTCGRLHRARAAIGFALTLTLTFACAPARAAPAPTLDGQPPIVIAHRGASGYLPEHTLAAYELAIRMGADYIEPDLQLTRDGELVALHDATLQRTTDVQDRFAPRDGGYRVADFTLAEIRTLQMRPVGTARLGYPGFTPTSAEPLRVPTFQEVIALARQQSARLGREVGLYPEAKQADPAMEDQILRTLAANGYTAGSKLFIQSFSAATIESIHRKQAALGLRYKLVVLAGSARALLGLGLDRLRGFADGVGVSITGEGMSQAFIDEAHAAGLSVHGYTFGKGDPAAALPEYARFFGWGMDGVFSNYPDLALSARGALPR